MTRLSNVMFVTNQKWASTQIRGMQVAKALGSYIDCSEVPAGVDTIIFVKSFPNNESINALINKNFRLIFDVIDACSTFDIIRSIPNAELIAIGDSAYQYLKNRFPFNKIWKIPEFHVDHPPVERTIDSKINVAGFIGYKENLTLDINQLSEGLKDLGIEFKTCFEFETEQDVIDFYHKIDIQLCYRIPNLHPHMPPEMKNPLKLANAGSFGIPTIAFPEIGYTSEWIEYYEFIPALYPRDLVENCKWLIEDNGRYEHISTAAFQKSQEYNKDKIIDLYKKMLGGKNDTSI